MKKVNEGPTIQKNHKGNHLTNADGEITKINGNTLTLEVEGEGGVPWDTETRVVKASECWIG